MSEDRGRLARPRTAGILGTADLQVHTALSDGMASPAQVVAWADAHTDLDLLAVTDHDDLRGALEAQEAAARMGARLQVVLGMEVTTLRGHLLALFLERPVPSFRSLAYTINAVHAQGGVCVIPHPLSPLTASIGARSIDRLQAAASTTTPPRPAFDGIELANPTPAARLRQTTARRLNRDRWRLPETGGSDAHFPEAIASAVTRFPGRSAADFRAALAAGLTVAESRSAPGLRQIGLRRLAWQQLRGLTATPRAAYRQVRPDRLPPRSDIAGRSP